MDKTINKAGGMRTRSYAFALGLVAAVKAWFGFGAKSIEAPKAGYANNASRKYRGKGPKRAPGTKLVRLTAEGNLTYCHRPGLAGRAVLANQMRRAVGRSLPTRHSFS